jgi:hypothetical protein
MPFHGSKLYVGIDSEGKEDGVLCTTNEEESNWLSMGYRFLPVRILTDSDRTTANWDRERGTLPVENTESSSSSNRNVTISSSDLLPLPPIFQGVDPLTAQNVILIYEKGTELYSPAYTWTLNRRTATWVDIKVKKNNTNAYYGLCKDYTYLHANRDVTGNQKINTKLSRINGKKIDVIALELMNRNPFL